MKPLLAILSEALDCVKQSKHYATWHNYRTTAKLVIKLMGGDATIINQDFVLTLAGRLRQRGECENTVRSHLRNFRALVYDSVPDKDVFKVIASNPQVTTKRSLGESQLRQLIAYEPKGKVEERAKDIFLLILLLNGTALVDLIFINKVSLVGDYIDFNRHKTGVHVNVPLTDVTRPLVEKYKSNDDASPYLFSFLDGCHDKVAKYKRYRSVMRSVNNGLHKIEKALGFDFPLTAYCARHSFASVAKLTGNSVDNIKTCMGHTATHTTEIYLRQLDKSVETCVNRAVIDFLYKKSNDIAASSANCFRPGVIIINNVGDMPTELERWLAKMPNIHPPYTNIPSIADRGNI